MPASAIPAGFPDPSGPESSPATLPARRPHPPADPESVMQYIWWIWRRWRKSTYCLPTRCWTISCTATSSGRSWNWLIPQIRHGRPSLLPVVEHNRHHGRQPEPGPFPCLLIHVQEMLLRQVPEEAGTGGGHPPGIRQGGRPGAAGAGGVPELGEVYFAVSLRG